MELNITVKNGSHFKHLTEEQVDEIRQNFCVDTQGKKLVTYSQKEPIDLCHPWQPTDGCGNPIGTVKNYDETQEAWV
jgi:hypothetical protein|tara:strand:- start:3261 stop:3491 length:231 start_codon:yes stop_codon:yes gene_type:complete